MSQGDAGTCSCGPFALYITIFHTCYFCKTQRVSKKEQHPLDSTPILSTFAFQMPTNRSFSIKHASLHSPSKPLVRSAGLLVRLPRNIRSAAPGPLVGLDVGAWGWRVWRLTTPSVSHALLLKVIEHGFSCDQTVCSAGFAGQFRHVLRPLT